MKKNENGTQIQNSYAPIQGNVTICSFFTFQLVLKICKIKSRTDFYEPSAAIATLSTFSPPFSRRQKQSLGTMEAPPRYRATVQHFLLILFVLLARRHTKGHTC
jgi:hypothetical protein